ncbi:MAG: hypothetical protein WAL22_17750 [Solirubrobacteraceae bacterium]
MALVLAATADAATTPSTPTSLTDCSGTVFPDSGAKAAGEPNLLDYKFRCNYGITAYTLIVEQLGDAQFGGTMDDYNPAPEVLEADGATPAPTEAITCEGTTPSDGINCNFGTLGASLTGGYYADGSIDPTAPFCEHLPTNAAGKTIDKPGTVAIPQASVWLVATDATGGQNGPFLLGYAKSAIKCPTVPKVVPAVKPVKTKGHGTKSKPKHG